MRRTEILKNIPSTQQLIHENFITKITFSREIWQTMKILGYTVYCLKYDRIDTKHGVPLLHASITCLTIYFTQKPIGNTQMLQHSGGEPS